MQRFGPIAALMLVGGCADIWGIESGVFSDSGAGGSAGAAQGGNDTGGAGAGATGGGGSGGTGSAGGGACDSDYSCLVLSHGPSSYYRLGDTEDLSPDIAGAFPAAHLGSGTIDAVAGAIAGDPNLASRFTGSQYLEVGFTYLFAPQQRYTIELWVRPAMNPSGSNGPPTLVDGLNTGPNPSLGWNVDLHPGDMLRLRSIRSANSTGAESALGDPLPPDVWSHVVVTHSTNTLTIYIDGAVSGMPLTPTSPIDAHAGAVTIGASAMGWGFFVGDLDEVAIYEKVLDPAEIKQHHDVGRGL
jgi:Concanavalin A-like lectin/glucanases superfamily